MDDPLVPELVEAIADAKGIDADALDIQLQEYIGVDVIQTLMSHETASWMLSFDLPTHDVTITSDGVIFVDGYLEEIWA